MIKRALQEKTNNVGFCKHSLTIIGMLLSLFFTPVCANATNSEADTTDHETTTEFNDDVIDVTHFSAPELFFMGYDWYSPSFKGNLKGLSRIISQNLKYPEDAYEKKIEGNVMLEFSISPEGAINNIKVGNDVDPLLSDEVIRCLKLTSGMWGKSGAKQEQPVYKINIGFEL